MQDDWRLASNFTLNFGLRYEFARSPVEIYDRSMYFSPDQAKIFVAGQGVRPDIVDPDCNNFAPRFGFTWRPGFAQNTVVRGGFGIYYATDNFNEEQFKGQRPAVLPGSKPSMVIPVLRRSVHEGHAAGIHGVGQHGARSRSIASTARRI